MPGRNGGGAAPPVRVGSMTPAAVAMMLGAVLGIVAFGLGLGVAALLFIADGSDFAPALVAAGIVMAVLGAVCGWAVTSAIMDRIDWPRLEAEQRLWRIGRLGRTRVRARRLLDRRDG